MHDAVPIVKLIRRWRIITGVLGYCGLASGLISGSVYVWPNIPRIPRPASGNIFPVNMHGTTIYWSEVELLTHRWLACLAGVLIVAAFGTDRLVRSLETRSQAESIRKQLGNQGDRSASGEER